MPSEAPRRWGCSAAVLGPRGAEAPLVGMRFPGETLQVWCLVDVIQPHRESGPVPNGGKAEERATPTQPGPLLLDQHGQHPKIWAQVETHDGLPKRLLGRRTRNSEGPVSLPVGGHGLRSQSQRGGCSLPTSC